MMRGLYSEKTGKTYDATVVLEDDGRYVGFKLEFDRQKGGGQNEALRFMNRKPFSSTIRPRTPPKFIPMTPRLLEKLTGDWPKAPGTGLKKDRQPFSVPKRCVSVREPYSAERRKAASERAKAAGYRPPIPKPKGTD